MSVSSPGSTPHDASDRLSPHHVDPTETPKSGEKTLRAGERDSAPAENFNLPRRPDPAGDSNNAKLETALGYAQNGYRVVVLSPGSREILTSGRLPEATNDAEQIREWWGAHPEANIGIVTDNLTVVEYSHGGATPQIKALARRRDVPALKVRRGVVQLFFANPPDRPIRSRAPTGPAKITIYGLGTYVVVPPGVIDGEELRWLDRQALAVSPTRLPLFPEALFDPPLEPLSDRERKLEELPRQLFPIARLHVRSHHDAEDLVGQALLSLFEGCRRGTIRLSKVRNLKAMAVRIMFRRMIDNRRKAEKRRDEVLMEPIVADPHPGPVQQLLSKEDAGIIDEAIEQLPQRYRDPIVRRYFNGATQEELAAHEGVSRQAIGSRLARALDRLSDIVSRLSQ